MWRAASSSASVSVCIHWSGSSLGRALGVSRWDTCCIDAHSLCRASLSARRYFLASDRAFPFPRLLDWLFVHGPRVLRTVFSFRLRGGRTDAQRVVGASDPRLTMRSAELIRHEGYAVEEHSVETRDGFVLGMQRIPLPHGASRRDGADGRARPAVLLQHGLMQCSEVWLTNGREGSLAFILADAGFDVWLGNNRGNTYSAKHTQLRADNPEYCEFLLSGPWVWRHDTHALTVQPHLLYCWA